MSLLTQRNTGQFRFNSLTELRALSGENLKAGEIVFLSSFSPAADGSERTYAWNTSSTDTDDGEVTIKLADTDIGRLKLFGAFKQSSTGAIPRTMLDKARESVTVLDFGANATPGTTDVTSILQAAVTAAAGKKLRIMGGGTYKVTSEITLSDSIEIEAEEGVIIDATGSFTGDYVFAFSGSAAQIQDLGSNPTEGATALTFATAPTLSAGDLIGIYNPTDYSYSGYRYYYRAGEFCEIRTASTTAITLKTPLYAGYTAASVDVYKITPVTVKIKGLKILGASQQGLVKIDYGRDCVIDLCEMDHSGYECILLQRCYNTKVLGVTLNNEGDASNYDYGVDVSSCQDTIIANSRIHSRRHAITTGAIDGVLGVPTRNKRTIGCTLSNDMSTSISCADFHGNTENSVYSDCTIFGGVNWGGKNNGYVNCRVIGAGTSKASIYGTEILGGLHYFKGGEIRTFSDPNTGLRGIVDIGGNTSTLTASTAEETTFEITGAKVYGRNLSSSTDFFKMVIDGTTKAMNIRLEDLEFDVDDIRYLLQTNRTSGTADSNFIVVDRISGNAPAGTKLANHSGSHFLNFPHRLQKQTGSETVTLDTGASIKAGSAVTYRWEYPRKPRVLISRNNAGYASNQLGIAYATSASATGMTPTIGTDDGTNFGSAITVDLDWVAVIDEV